MSPKAPAIEVQHAPPTAASPSVAPPPPADVPPPPAAPPPPVVVTEHELPTFTQAPTAGEPLLKVEHHGGRTGLRVQHLGPTQTRRPQRDADAGDPLSGVLRVDSETVAKAIASCEKNDWEQAARLLLGSKL